MAWLLSCCGGGFYGYSGDVKYHKITDYEEHYGCCLDSGANTSN